MAAAASPAHPHPTMIVCVGTMAAIFAAGRAPVGDGHRRLEPALPARLEDHDPGGAWGGRGGLQAEVGAVHGVSLSFSGAFESFGHPSQPNSSPRRAMSLRL
jgi:hypothetical protein